MASLNDNPSKKICLKYHQKNRPQSKLQQLDPPQLKNAATLQQQQQQQLNNLPEPLGAECDWSMVSFSFQPESIDDSEKTADDLSSATNVAMDNSVTSEMAVKAPKTDLEGQGEKPYHCYLCDVAFGTENAMRLHWRVHEDESEEGDVMEEDGGEGGAIKTMIAPVKREIDIADELWMNANDVVKEMDGYNYKDNNSNNPMLSLTCVVCAMTYASAEQRAVHERRHTGLLPVHCDFCHLSFRDLDKLMLHESSHDDRERKRWKEKTMTRLKTAGNTWNQNMLSMAEETTSQSGTTSPLPSADSDTPSLEFRLPTRTFSRRPPSLKRQQQKHQQQQQEQQPRRPSPAVSSTPKLRATSFVTIRRSWPCSLYANEFATANRRDDHEKLHEQGTLKKTNKKSWSCSFCARKFKTRQGRDIHEEQHKRGRMDCDICQLSFGSYFEMKNHHFSFHTNTIQDKNGKRDFEMWIDEQIRSRQKRTEEEKNEAKHQKVHEETHNTERNYACDICDKKFKSQQCLTRHADFHNPEKVKCELCDQAFHSMSHLKYHLEHHTGIRKYACPTGRARGKTYVSKNDMYQHKRLYAATFKDGAIRCDRCGAASPSLRRLSRHILYHCPAVGKTEKTTATRQRKRKTTGRRSHRHVSDSNVLTFTSATELKKHNCKSIEEEREWKEALEAEDAGDVDARDAKVAEEDHDASIPERLSKSANDGNANAREGRTGRSSHESAKDDERLMTPAEMTIHEAGVSENNEFECYFCPEVFSDELRCLEHQRTHYADDM